MYAQNESPSQLPIASANSSGSTKNALDKSPIKVNELEKSAKQLTEWLRINITRF